MGREFVFVIRHSPIHFSFYFRMNNTQENCPAGFVQKYNASTFCLPCLPGSAQSNIAQKDCIGCEVGRYAPSANEELCKPCRRGRAENTVAGSSKCASCRAGFYVSFIGNQPDNYECLACIPGKISHSELGNPDFPVQLESSIRLRLHGHSLT